jgi:hypothetical protein
MTTALELYKNELKNILGIKTDDLFNQLKRTFIPLKNTLESLVEDRDLLTSVMKLEHIRMVEFDEDEDNAQQVAYINCIHDLNRRKEESFNCACGKNHLKNLHLFKHENCDQHIVIGSTCIRQIVQLKKIYSTNQELCSKLDKLLGDLKTAEKVLTHKQCKTCKDLCIRKDKKSEDMIENHLCKNCYNKKEQVIRCKDCRIWIEVGYDYRGCVKRRCFPCWKKKKNS